MASAHDGCPLLCIGTEPSRIYVRRFLQLYEMANLVHRLWNYNPLNDDAEGDTWNGENFSWFSNFRARKPNTGTKDQTDASLDQGGRILESVVRPYPAKVSGIPIMFEYDVNRGEFSFEWAKPYSTASMSTAIQQEKAEVSRPPLHGHPEITSRLTEFYIPQQLIKGKKYVVALDGAAQGSKWWYDAGMQTLFVEQPDPATIPDGAKYRLVFGLTPALKPKWPVRNHWQDFAFYYLSVLAVIASILTYFLL